MSVKLKDTPRSESAAIVATGAAFFVIVLDTSIVNLALPRIKDVFHADLTALRSGVSAPLDEREPEPKSLPRLSRPECAEDATLSRCA
jgi:hypothetical protein